MRKESTGMFDSGAARWLENIETVNENRIDIIKTVKLVWVFSRHFNIETNGFNTSLNKIHVVSIDKTERQLLVLLKIIRCLNRIDIMHPDEFEYSHGRIAYQVILKMFYEIRRTQNLVPFTKSEQVNG